MATFIDERDALANQYAADARTLREQHGDSPEFESLDDELRDRYRAADAALRARHKFSAGGPEASAGGMMENWFEKGKEAGKTEGWMTIEETLSETLARHKKVEGPIDLVLLDMEGWEGTDHFGILYASKMMKEASQECPTDLECAIDKFQDMKTQFWEGYLTGRKEIGIDIYQKAAGLLRRK